VDVIVICPYCQAQHSFDPAEVSMSAACKTCRKEFIPTDSPRASVLTPAPKRKTVVWTWNHDDRHPRTDIEQFLVWSLGISVAAAVVGVIIAIASSR